MARVNVGVNPKYLTDQWLVAESVEITMITGSLRKNNYEIKSDIPNEYKLGKGHINFFKNKLVYLKRRLEAVNNEMTRRGFSPGTSLDLSEFPDEYLNDWKPSMKDSCILRNRLAWKYNNKSDYWRYCSEYISDHGKFVDGFLIGKLYKV